MMLSNPHTKSIIFFAVYTLPPPVVTVQNLTHNSFLLAWVPVLPLNGWIRCYRVKVWQRNKRWKKKIDTTLDNMTTSALIGGLNSGATHDVTVLAIKSEKEPNATNLVVTTFRGGMLF